ncbi:hypothetical protein TMatcc_006338 [Talaromyces marneffei ATCC 18224]|uniref:Aspergillopepsin F, putative n=2 Tax=Talaromyces marneffei TaxID=37727 RepID=B6QBG2_TALMQ|nr:aspergillopepsin F precursor, putative [Talaromyces marneffei ATCC 18224]KAE8554163.1 hypothetical protein EYB25_002701 [Talaromyces marneffei]
MVNCQTIISALALSALAAPAAAAAVGPGLNPGKRFTLDLVPVKRGPAHPAARYVDTLDRYGGRASDRLRSVANPKTGSTSVTPHANNTQYHIPVKLGNSNMTLRFDTGSANLWVTINETIGRGSHRPFDNSTCKRYPGYTFDASWRPLGEILGDVCEDKVTIGGITAEKQAIQLALHMSQEISEHLKDDGNIGFAFTGANSILPDPQKPWFENVKNDLQDAVFVVDLRRGGPGSIDFGFVDPKYTSRVFWAYVDSGSGFWKFIADGYMIGQGSGFGDWFSGILDTGNDLILLPQEFVKHYYKHVPDAVFDEGQGGYIFPCNTTLPAWTVIIEYGLFTVPGNEINVGPVGNGSCYGGIQGNGGLPYAIFGNLFFGQVIIIFESKDGHPPMVGFATKA